MRWCGSRGPKRARYLVLVPTEQEDAPDQFQIIRVDQPPELAKS